MNPKARARFTRWYFRADYDPEKCPWWIRPLYNHLFDCDLYIFMAFHQDYWKVKERRRLMLFDRIMKTLF